MKNSSYCCKRLRKLNLSIALLRARVEVERFSVKEEPESESRVFPIINLETGVRIDDDVGIGLVPVSEARAEDVESLLGRAREVKGGGNRRRHC